MRWGLLLALVAMVPGAFAAQPGVDVAAMREAMGLVGREPEPFARYPAAASYAHFLKARLAELAGAPDRAIDELVLALATDASSPTLNVALAEAYARRGDLGRAAATLEALLRYRPRDASARRLLGRVLAEARHPARAVKRPLKLLSPPAAAR